MSGLGLPENRPALPWLATVPPDWTTPQQRLLLTALCLDSFDGYTCAPGRSDLMAFCGVQWVRTFNTMRDALAKPTEKRPPLIEVDATQGRHTRYRILRPHVSTSLTSELVSEPLTSEQSGHVSTSLTSGTGSTTADMSGPLVSDTCQVDLSGSLVSESLTYPSSPHPDQGGGMREEDGSYAPALPGADTTRLEADVFAVLGQRWPDDQPVVSKRSRRLLRELLAGGWAESQIIRAVKGIPKNPRNPALLLETHLAKVLAEHEPRDVGPVSDVGTATGDPALAVDQADDIPRCRHGVSRRLPKGSCAACVDHHDQLRAAFAEAERHGFTVNRGAKDDDGERPFNLIAGNVRIGVYLDKYEDPFDVWIEARRPSRDLLVFMYQFGDVEADQDGAHTVDVALDADQDGTPRVVAGLAKSLASLRHRDTQPKETA